MRQRDSLSPEDERELDALERALAGEPVDHDLRELAELVEDVRATAPQMSPGFAASLEHRVAEGFPATDEHPAPRRPRRWISFLPAAGVAAACLLALVVVLGNTTTATNDALEGSGANTAVAPSEGAAKSSGGAAQEPAAAPQPERLAAPSASSTSAAPAVAADQAAGRSPGAPAAGSGERKVERTADLVLRVPTDKVASTSDGVIRTVDRFGGIVASSASQSDDDTGEATFALRIPTERLDDALAALSKLGHVAQRSQNLTDITGSFTSVQDRLSDARAERRGLLRALGRASTQQQIDSLRARLRTVRSQIARLSGDLDALRRRADLSSVSVTVRGGGSESEGATGSGGSWSPGDAARDAVRVLEVMAGVLLITLAIVVPLALLALAGAFGVRATRRHRRESALDPA